MEKRMREEAKVEERKNYSAFRRFAKIVAHVNINE